MLSPSKIGVLEEACGLEMVDEYIRRRKDKVLNIVVMFDQLYMPGCVVKLG